MIEITKQLALVWSYGPREGGGGIYGTYDISMREFVETEKRKLQELANDKTFEIQEVDNYQYVTVNQIITAP